MAYGYMGKVLLIDLGTGDIREEPVPDEIYEQYLSGTGLAVRLLYRMIPPGADPLGPENVLGFFSGLLTGTGSLFTGRWMAAAKSPLTGTWGDANSGGMFSPAIKRCGYDGILFRGISPKPVYFYADGPKAELRDAGSLWGKDTEETDRLLKTETSGRAQAALIGPAGESLSLISGICTDRGRIAARSGLGAVMGSKRLKAVVLEGKRRIPVKDRAAVKALSSLCSAHVPRRFPVSGKLVGWLGVLLRVLPLGMAMDGRIVLGLYRKWGTTSTNQLSIEGGDAPIRNWAGSNLDFDLKRSAPLDPDRIRALEKVKYHCHSCPLGCGGICTLPGGARSGAPAMEVHKPEYESVLALSGLCLNGDADDVFRLNEMLNRAGMDTISAGATAAFAIECFEKGLLTRDDTGGVDLAWGDPGSVRFLIEKMVRREGIGEILADGSKAVAARIGKGADNYAVHAGGQEPAMHDGRNDPGYAIHYSVEPTPGRHTLGSWMYYEMWQLWKVITHLPHARPLYFKKEKYGTDGEKIRIAAANSRFMNVVNGIGMCMFGTFLGAGRIPVFDWINAATGWDKTPEDYMAVGDRIQTLKQAFNVRQGIEPASLRLSARALGLPPMKHGANKGCRVDIEALTRGYWAAFGWDPETGKPKPEGLRKLGLDHDWAEGEI